MGMVEKWMAKTKKMVKLMGLMLCLLLSNGCSFGDENGENLGDSWQKQSSTAVVSQTYQDAQGHAIVYYCCQTTYYTEAAQEQFAKGKVDRDAIETVVSLAQTVLQECWVGDWPAFLCEQDGRTYLCWTISPEFSCIIEYDADAVAEEDIFHMAESVIRS